MSQQGAVGVRYKTAQSVVKGRKRIKPNEKETETVTVVQTSDLLTLFFIFSTVWGEAKQKNDEQHKVHPEETAPANLTKSLK